MLVERAGGLAGSADMLIKRSTFQLSNSYSLNQWGKAMISSLPPRPNLGQLLRTLQESVLLIYTLAPLLCLFDLLLRDQPGDQHTGKCHTEHLPYRYPTRRSSFCTIWTYQHSETCWQTSSLPAMCSWAWSLSTHTSLQPEHTPITLTAVHRDVQSI